LASFERHIFVCTNERPADDPRGHCAAAGGGEVAKALKIAAYERGLKRVVRVNKAGCLDQCARGVTCVVYPENVWYGGVTVEDAAEIVERHLDGGEPLERLVIPHEELTGRARGCEA
jgi:(2Fe-2S) ferredoxin